MPFDEFLTQVRQVDFSLPEHEPLLVQSISYLGNYGVRTRQDRLQLQLAFLELTALYLRNYLGYPQETEILGLRKEIQEAYQRLYAPDSMGLRCQQFLQEVSAKILEQEYEAALATLSESFQTLSDWDYASSESNDALFQNLILQLHSLQILIQFTEAYPEDHEGKSTAEQLLARCFIRFQDEGFDPESWIKASQELENLKPTLTEEAHAYCFNVLIALLLYFDPEHVPLLEKMGTEHVVAIQTYMTSLQVESPEMPQPSTELDTPEIIQNYQARMEKDGFSEHAMYEAIALVRKRLDDESMDFDGYIAFVGELVDCSRQYANAETNELLDEVIQGLLAMKDYVEQAPDPPTAEEIKKEMEANIAELDRQLTGGRSVSAALTRFFNQFTLLTLKLGSLSEDELPLIAELFRLFIPTLLRTIEKQVPEEMRPFYPQIQQFYSQITAFMDQLGDPEWQQDLAMENFGESTQRFIGAAHLLPIAPGFEDNRMIRQFLELFPQLAIRMANLDENLQGEDKKEAERIQAAREDTMNLLRSAYTLPQLIQHQQFGLRQIAYDIGQFERRKLLYFSPSSLPAHEVILHVNQVFFSGAPAVRGILEKSCRDCGLQLATQKSNTTSLDDRWIQLRESGLAIFDFSGFDPALSDPKEWKHTEAENTALQHASLTALAAFECGWALALGKPMVVILKAGQTAPFDIDIHPCRLQEDEDDVHRLIEAIQVATYGKPRISKDNLLPHSADYLKTIASSLPEDKTQDLLQAIDANVQDATLLKLVGKSLLKLIPGGNHLAFQPPFAGVYPKQAGQRQLFHVTAFRPWSKATEHTIRSVCGEMNLAYRVGYDSLDPEIMAAIWKDLTAADFVVADITLLNPNAVLELAVAMALGKPTLIIHQHEFIQRFFPPLQKTRTHHYDTDQAPEHLRSLLKAFLSGQ